MSDNDWKKEIIREKLGGKHEWTDSERKELCHSLDNKLDKEINNASQSATTMKDRWTEDNWKQKMGEHPIFTPYLQDEGTTEAMAEVNPLSEGLAQLQYHPDHNEPIDIATNYKTDGIMHFKYKKYNLAIAAFTEGLKQKFDDSQLKAQLHNNRAAAHQRLGNNRSSLRDCECALLELPDYKKASLRAVQCAMVLQDWDQVIRLSDTAKEVHPEEQFFTNSRKQAIMNKKLKERDHRRTAASDKQKFTKKQLLLGAIATRGITLNDGVGCIKDEDQSKQSEEETIVNIKPSSLPSGELHEVHLNSDHELVWPVVLLYPEYQQMDHIDMFNEKQCFYDHLEVIFGDSSPPPPWDVEQKYKVADILLFFIDVDDRLVNVEVMSTLFEVLTDKRYRVSDGTPNFIVAVKGTIFLEHLIQKYKKL